MLGPNRNHRIETLLQKDIAEIILQEIKDPRISSWVSVSDVVLSKDKSFAKIYITMIGDETEHRQAIEVLNKATSFFRVGLAKRIRLKYIPGLEFVMDRTIVEGMRLSSLINS